MGCCMLCCVPKSSSSCFSFVKAMLVRLTVRGGKNFSVGCDFDVFCICCVPSVVYPAFG